MFIELEPIFNCDGAEKEFSYEFAPDGCDEIKSVAVKGKVFNRTGIVSLEANALYELDTLCDRCASSVKRNEELAISHFLVSELNDEDNDEYYLVENMNFNLDELVREDILLSLPTKILCREDCRGICPYCGANLNEKQCDCKKPVDPRLEALKQFLD